jgi:hypothetical protein
MNKSRLSKIEKSLKPEHQKVWEAFYREFYSKLPPIMLDLHASGAFYHLSDTWNKEMNAYGVGLLQYCRVNPEDFEKYMTENVHLLEQLESFTPNLSVVPSVLPNAPQAFAAIEERLDTLEGFFMSHLEKAYCVLLVYEFYAWSIAAQEAKEAKKSGVLA